MDVEYEKKSICQGAEKGGQIFVRVREVRLGGVTAGGNRSLNRVNESGPQLLPDRTGAQNFREFRHQARGNLRSHFQKSTLYVPAANQEQHAQN